MAKGGHGLPKVSPEPAMPNPSTPCERATPETAIFYPFEHSTPYAYGRAPITGNGGVHCLEMAPVAESWRFSRRLSRSQSHKID
jgi:hypothetical protein